ncbi:MAG: helix-turn-helix transcriptional regulator [Erysipelotrichaceae bacterium]|nr:helix-turn-helix transcriptional regulator [Erysipelotrichaceae bacterium]
MNLGKKIYEQRIKKNLSQEDLANLLNVSRQSVSKWENNNTVPDLEKMIKLSEIFEISLDELVKGEKSSSNHNVQVVTCFHHL